MKKETKQNKKQVKNNRLIYRDKHFSSNGQASTKKSIWDFLEIYISH